MRSTLWIAAFVLVMVVVLGAAATSTDAGEPDVARGRFDRDNTVGRLLSERLNPVTAKNRITVIRSNPPTVPYDQLAEEQFVAPDIRTAADVGELSGPSGVRISEDGIAIVGLDQREFEFYDGSGNVLATLLLNSSGTLFSIETGASTSPRVFSGTGNFYTNADYLPDASDNRDIGTVSDRWRRVVANQHVAADPLLTASENLTAGDVVWITGSGTVGKTLTSIDATKVAGVVVADATSGNLVGVAIGGFITVTANGAITAGDRVQISTASAGRVAKLTTVTSGAGSAHAHTNPTTGAHTGGTLLEMPTSGHTHTENDAGGQTGGPSATEQWVSKNDHTHSQANSGNESSHTHTVTPGTMLGKAITSAAGAGNTLTILITLGG